MNLCLLALSRSEGDATNLAPFFFFLLTLLTGFVLGLLLGWRRTEYDRQAIDKLTRESMDREVAWFSEDMRLRYMTLVLQSMHDITKGAPLVVPRSRLAIEEIWREAEFRYRHWMSEESMKDYQPSSAVSKEAN